jgi:hypothetical protein
MLNKMLIQLNIFLEITIGETQSFAARLPFSFVQFKQFASNIFE